MAFVMKTQDASELGPPARFTQMVAVVLCTIALIFSSCQKDPEDSLKGCCLNTAVNVDFGNAHLYIPNIFTPDGDLINDLLWLCADSVALINKLEIENRSGNIVFEASNVAPSDPSVNWDGRVGTVTDRSG
jgi:hypothetical protein